MTLIIKNGIVLRPDGKEKKLDVAIQGGIITDIDEEIDPAEHQFIDACGAYVLPGFIDMNCRIYDPGNENIEDLSSAGASAAKGGYTSLTIQPCTYPAVDNKTVVNYIISRSGKLSLVNVYLYGSMTVGGGGEKIAEIGEMIAAGIVALSDGGKCISDTSLMRNIMRYSSMFNIPVITACEDEELSKGGSVNEGRIATAYGLRGIPKEAEEIIVARNIILSAATGCNLHLAGISTKGSVELIKDARKKGVKLTCETHPHYFTLTEELIEGYNTYAKVKPPLRCAEDVEAICEGLTDGVIDVIASGHTPASIESKNREFDTADFGISALETAFSVSYNALVASGKMPMAKLVEKFSKTPARILSLGNKGEIKRGNDADIVIFSGNEKYYINPEDFASRARFSPYDGKTVTGKVKHTIVGGKIVYMSYLNE